MIEGHKSPAVEMLRVAIRAIGADDDYAALLAIEAAVLLMLAPDEPLPPGSPLLFATADGDRLFETMRER